MAQYHDKEEQLCEVVLKHVIYNHENNKYYAYIPNNHVIITNKNKESLTINKLELDIGNSCDINIGGSKFLCDLYTRQTDDSVLLSIRYLDNPYERTITKYHEEKLIKYIEAMILGFLDHVDDYEEKPEKFFDLSNNKIKEYIKNTDEITDAW